MIGASDDPEFQAVGPWVDGERALGLRLRPPTAADAGGAPERLDLEPLRAEFGPRGLRLLPLSPEPAESSLASGALPGGLLVVRSPLWAPYRLGDFAYDPLGALAGTLLRQSRERAGGAGARAGAEDAALALWARLELDLVRFARDELVRKACDEARGQAECARFAAFNDLARALIRCIVPLGLAPADWKAWLREEPPRARGKGAWGRLLVPARRLAAAPFRERLLVVLRRSGTCTVAAWSTA